MRFISIILLAILLCACTHDRVMGKYKSGNPHARDLLLHGLNEKNAEYVSSFLVDRALEGDEEAKAIIYAQIDTLRGMQSTSTRVVPVIMPIHHR
jgi:hypothetical protein